MPSDLQAEFAGGEPVHLPDGGGVAGAEGGEGAADARFAPSKDLEREEVASTRTGKSEQERHMA